MDPEDESTLLATKREVEEETGYTFKHWKLIDVRQNHTKIESFVYIYVAWDVLHKGATNHDAGERIVSGLKGLDELQSLAEQGLGYLGELRPLIKDLQAARELIDLSEYKGVSVNR